MSEFGRTRPDEFDARSIAWMHATQVHGLPLEARVVLREPSAPHPDLVSGLLGTYALRRRFSRFLPGQLPVEQSNVEPYQEEIDQGGSNNFYG